MNRSTYLALSLLVLLGVWMLSGALSEDEAVSEKQVVERNEKAPMRVKVEELIAKEISQEIILQGKLEPARQVEIKSQLATTVADVIAQKGATVEAGDVLVSMSLDDREALVQQAQAELVHLTLEVKAANELLAKGLNSENLLRSAEANLARGKAQLDRAKLALSHTQIKAPFAGVWDQRYVEKGSHLDVGQGVGMLVDNSVLKAVGFVSQQAVSKLTMGQTVSVLLLDGSEATGTLSYIAKVGENTTQSFRIEADIPNPDNMLHAGASAEIRIETGTQLAHFVAPSVFSLGQSGEVGIKSVDDSGKVVFYPVELVRKDLNGVWVTGLPHTLTLITLGQGFVQEGEAVTAVKKQQKG